MVRGDGRGEMTHKGAVVHTVATVERLEATIERLEKKLENVRYLLRCKVTGHLCSYERNVWGRDCKCIACCAAKDEV